MAVITISREFASGGDQVARRVCELLDYRYFDKELMYQVAHEQGFSDLDVADLSEDSYRTRSFVDRLLRAAAVGNEFVVTPPLFTDEAATVSFITAAIRGLRRHGRVVVVGRGGQAILADDPDVLHVRIIARERDRIRRVLGADGVRLGTEREFLRERDQSTDQYLRRFHDIDWTDPALYHLTLNTSLLGEEDTAQLIATAARRLDAKSEADPCTPAS